MNWDGVTLERRALVRLGMRLRLLDTAPGPSERRRWAKVLSSGSGLADEWITIAGKHAEMTASQKEAPTQAATRGCSTR